MFILIRWCLLCEKIITLFNNTGGQQLNLTAICTTPLTKHYSHE